MTRLLRSGLAVLLWLTSIGLGIVEIGTVRNALLTLYGWIVTRNGDAPGNTQATVGLISQAIVVFLALGVMGLVVGTGEYHVKYFGERRSWRLLGWVLGIELLILLVTYPLA